MNEIESNNVRWAPETPINSMTLCNIIHQKTLSTSFEIYLDVVVLLYSRILGISLILHVIFFRVSFFRVSN